MIAREIATFPLGMHDFFIVTCFCLLYEIMAHVNWDKLSRLARGVSAVEVGGVLEVAREERARRRVGPARYHAHACALAAGARARNCSTGAGGSAGWPAREPRGACSATPAAPAAPRPRAATMAATRRGCTSASTGSRASRRAGCAAGSRRRAGRPRGAPCGSCATKRSCHGACRSGSSMERAAARAHVDLGQLTRLHRPRTAAGRARAAL